MSLLLLFVGPPSGGQPPSTVTPYAIVIAAAYVSTVIATPEPVLVGVE